MTLVEEAVIIDQRIKSPGLFYYSEFEMLQALNHERHPLPSEPHSNNDVPEHELIDFAASNGMLAKFAVKDILEKKQQKQQNNVTWHENADRFLKHLDQKVPHHVFFDFETGPKPDSELMKFFDLSKVKLPQPPGIFNADSVKIGNLGKNQTKIREKIAEAQASHARAVADYGSHCNTAKINAFADFRDDAALESHLNVVVACGYGYYDGNGVEVYIDTRVEKEIIERFWYVVKEVRRQSGKIFGFNSNRFDLPLAQFKAWQHGLDVPYLRTKYNKWDECCIDVSEYANMGVYGKTISLKNLTKALGVTEKSDEIEGKFFHKEVKENRERALRYLALDIVSLYEAAERMRMMELAKMILKSQSKKENVNV